MDLKVYIHFIKFMAYNIKYQQKAYIIILCIKSMLIFYTISCELIWQYWIN